MLRSWVVYGALIVGSALVGFLVGGGPDAIRSSPTPALPASSPTTQDPTAAEPDATEPTTSTTSTPASSTSAPEASTTTSSTTTSTTIPTTSATTTTTTTTTPPPTSTTAVPEVLRPRDELSVAVANGVGTVGVAGIGGRALAALGYTDPAARDAAVTGTTQVYFAPGFEGEASRLALDVGLDASTIAPVADIPELIGSGPSGFELILMLGADGLGPR